MDGLRTVPNRTGMLQIPVNNEDGLPRYVDELYYLEWAIAQFSSMDVQKFLWEPSAINNSEGFPEITHLLKSLQKSTLYPSSAQLNYDQSFPCSPSKSAGNNSRKWKRSDAPKLADMIRKTNKAAEFSYRRKILRVLYCNGTEILATQVIWHLNLETP